MDTKNLSSCQVQWVKKFSQYHFHIDYLQNKTNAATDALSKFSKRTKAEKKAIKTENTQILYKLQFLLKVIIFNLYILDLLLSSFSILHQILICGTNVLLQLQKS